MKNDKQKSYADETLKWMRNSADMSEAHVKENLLLDSNFNILKENEKKEEEKKEIQERQNEKRKIEEFLQFDVSTQAFIHLVSGGVAGGVSRTLTAPLDRIKMIMQVNVSAGGVSVYETLQNVYKEGGICAFFRGNATNCLKVTPESAIKFFAFDFFKKQICQWKNRKKGDSNHTYYTHEENRGGGGGGGRRGGEGVIGGGEGKGEGDAKYRGNEAEEKGGKSLNGGKNYYKNNATDTHNTLTKNLATYSTYNNSNSANISNNNNNNNNRKHIVNNNVYNTNRVFSNMKRSNSSYIPHHISINIKCKIDKKPYFFSSYPRSFLPFQNFFPSASSLYCKRKRYNNNNNNSNNNNNNINGNNDSSSNINSRHVNALSYTGDINRNSDSNNNYIAEECKNNKIHKTNKKNDEYTYNFVKNHVNILRSVRLCSFLTLVFSDGPSALFDSSSTSPFPSSSSLSSSSPSSSSPSSSFHLYSDDPSEYAFSSSPSPYFSSSPSSSPSSSFSSSPPSWEDSVVACHNCNLSSSFSAFASRDGFLQKNVPSSALHSRLQNKNEKIYSTSFDTSSSPSVSSLPSVSTSSSSSSPELRESSGGKESLTIVEKLVAGGAAGGLALSIVYPIDVVKTRLAISAKGTYSGVYDCLMRTCKQEGGFALYRGLALSLLGIIPYCAIDFTVFETLKNMYCKYMTSKHSSKLQGKNNNNSNLSTSNNNSNTINNNSTSNNNNNNNMTTSTINNNSFDNSNNSNDNNTDTRLAENIILQTDEHCTPDAYVLLTMGAISCCVGQVFAYPMALLRTRLQVDGMGGGKETKKYKSGVQAFKLLLKNEGVMGLYKGILPNLMKAVPVASLGWLLYESTKLHMQNYVVNKYQY